MLFRPCGLMTKLRQQKNSHVKILFDMHVLQLSVLEKYWPALHTDAGTKVCAETLFIMTLIMHLLGTDYYHK